MVRERAVKPYYYLVRFQNITPIYLSLCSPIGRDKALKTPQGSGSSPERGTNFMGDRGDIPPWH